ncbi:hypothetical protein BGZ94_004483 [Podila epigama]|nr:hypothetical protein BGZ94_004483 [Podila epigama]
MVQHTQTHTKGPHPESSEEIAQKIALETRRKSEAGLLGAGTGAGAGGRGMSKAAKRLSGSGSPPKETVATRQTRAQSIPSLVINNTRNASSKVSYSPTSESSQHTSPTDIYDLRHKSVKRAASKKSLRRVSVPASGHHRTGSLEAPSPKPPVETWYASRLHHRPSLDYGLDMHARRSAAMTMGNRDLDTHLPPLHPYPQSQAHGFAAASPHPFSIEKNHVPPAAHQEPAYGAIQETVPETVPAYWNSQTPSQALYRDSPTTDSCTLPPLRTGHVLAEPQTRLSNIVNGRYRSQSMSFDPAYGAPASYHRTRRLSLVDLETPIQEATMAVHHSVMASSQMTTLKPENGVDVSEDEMQALQAFGELWSRGRDKQSLGQHPLQRHSTPPGDAGVYEATTQESVPSLDHGHRPQDSFDVMGVSPLTESMVID